jgi:hypothetical protein
MLRTCGTGLTHLKKKKEGADLLLHFLLQIYLLLKAKKEKKKMLGAKKETKHERAAE